MPPAAELQSYVVYVGFDEAGDRGQPQAQEEGAGEGASRAPKPQKKLERSVLPGVPLSAVSRL